MQLRKSQDETSTKLAEFEKSATESQNKAQTFEKDLKAASTVREICVSARSRLDYLRPCEAGASSTYHFTQLCGANNLTGEICPCLQACRS